MIVQGSNFGDVPVFRHNIHEKQYNYPTHMHQFAEIVYMHKGQTCVVVDGRREYLNDGEFALILPFQAHSFSSSSVVKIGMYLFSPHLLADFLNVNDGMAGDRACFAPSVSTLQIHNEKIFTAKDLSLFSVKSFLYSLLSDYLANVNLVKKRSDTGIVPKVIGFLNEHFEEQISLKDVAVALGYSSNYLSHCLKGVFEMNFCALLASIRVDKARRLLAETDKTSLQISDECGFGSERSFHRHFKAITGRSPGEYRARFSCSSVGEQNTVYYK